MFGGGVVTPTDGEGSSVSGAGGVGDGVAMGTAVGAAVGIAVGVMVGVTEGVTVGAAVAVVGIAGVEIAVGAGTTGVGSGDRTTTLGAVVGVGELVTVGSAAGVGSTGCDVTIGCGVDVAIGVGDASTATIDGVIVGSVVPVHAAKIVARTTLLKIASRAVIVWFFGDSEDATVRV